MTRSQEFSDETRDSSQLSALEVNKATLKPRCKNDDKTLLNPSNPTSDVEQNPPIIVHPSYSRPASTAFHYQVPLSHTQGLFSKYLSRTKMKSPEKLNYLPPQQYGGMPDELDTKDKNFKIQMADDELNRSQFSCYKWWLLIFIGVSLLSIAGFACLIFTSTKQTPRWITGLFAFLMIWNLLQCVVEYLAIRARDFVKAEKAVKSFCLFLLVIFISSVAINLRLEADYMQNKSGEARVLIAIIISFITTVLYYATTIPGAIKVYQVLKKKQNLEISLKEEICFPSELHSI